MSYSLDLTLVLSVQAGNMNDALRLYQKYERLIKNRARLTRMPSDFVQTAFEVMVASAKKVDVYRIKNLDDWGFYFQLSMDLLKAALKMNKEELHQTGESRWCNGFESSPVEFFTGDSTSIPVESRAACIKKAAPSIFNQYLPEREVFRASSLEVSSSFLKKCSSTERYLLKLRRRGMSLSECARSMGMRHADVSHMLKTLRASAKTHFDRATF